MRPLEALENAMFYVCGSIHPDKLNKPGAVIERMSAEARQALQQLKSDDIVMVRQDRLIGDEKYYDRKHFEETFCKEMMSFDLKMKKPY